MDDPHGCLSDVFEIPHGEVDGYQACVDPATGRDPDGPVDVEGGAKELTFLLWPFTCLVLDIMVQKEYFVKDEE